MTGSALLSFTVTLEEGTDGWVADVSGDDAPGVIGQAMDTARDAIVDAIDDYLIGAGYLEVDDDA